MFPGLVYMEGYHKESFNSRNGEYMMELAGMSDTGLDYIVYCEE